MCATSYLHRSWCGFTTCLLSILPIHLAHTHTLAHTPLGAEGASFITVTFSMNTRPESPCIRVRVSRAPCCGYNSNHLKVSKHRSASNSSTSMLPWEAHYLSSSLSDKNYEGTADHKKQRKHGLAAGLWRTFRSSCVRSVAFQ